MEDERIKIFDDREKEIGVATRRNVHKKGYWHETFHCWFLNRKNKNNYIYFQIRSSEKKDYPNLLDITAAGHILSHETIYDGIREVREEVGIDVTFDEIEKLGIIKYCTVQGDFIDKELAHVFVYQNDLDMDEFKLQFEEVSGIVKANFNDFYKLFLGNTSEMLVEGFQINKAGHKVNLNKKVTKTDFVPHEHTYFETILKLIAEKLK